MRAYCDISEALQGLCGDVFESWRPHNSRNGLTMEVTNHSVMLHKPWQKEMILDGRRCSLPAQIFETVWMLAGCSYIGALSAYLPRAKDFSDDGKTWRGAYGPRLRGGVGNEHPDQLTHCIDLLQEDPDTRRAVMAIYDPHVDTLPGKDIPCNDFIQFLIRDGQLITHIYVRSNDLIWGFSGINAFEWGAMAEIVAELVGVSCGPLVFTQGSLHAYEWHFGKVKELAKSNTQSAAVHASPRFDPPSGVTLDSLLREWLEIEAALRNGTSPGLMLDQRVHKFPEPMLRSWLKIIAHWWTFDDQFLTPDLEGTRLLHAYWETPGRKKQEEAYGMVAEYPPATGHYDAQAFIEYVDSLHRTKGAAYGDSWCRRGEQLAIQANIARKVDRLGKTDDQETAADTAIDLAVYLAKYQGWLAARNGVPQYDEFLDCRNRIELALSSGEEANGDPIGMLRGSFEALIIMSAGWTEQKEKLVEHMLNAATVMACAEWRKAKKEDDRNPYTVCAEKRGYQ